MTAIAPKTDALMPITGRPPLVFVEGEGSWLRDEEGRAYLDFVQGWAVNCLGHCHPAVVEALAGQGGTLINCSPAFYNRPMLELAGLIAQHSCFEQVFFANSGAEANEGAIKLARKWGQLHRGGAYQIITMEHGFHGRTLATMSASGKPQWEGLYEPKVEGVPKARLNDIDSVKARLGEETVAVMLEPIQGEAGVLPASDEFVRQLRQLTGEAGVLLIVDEIQTGVGRTGRLFAYQHTGIEPDIMTLGKGLGAGVPLAALVAKEAVCCFEPGDQGGTFNGNPLISAVGKVVMETVAQPQFLAQVEAAGDHLRAGLEGLAHRHGLGQVRGRGLLQALEVAPLDGPQLVHKALQQGLLINAPGAHTLRFMPALTVTAAEIDRMLTLLDGILAA